MPVIVPPANCFTVLVIDDLLPNRVLLGKVLQGAGYAVMEASNGLEAMRLLEGEGGLPDLIVTDIEMPEMDGIALVEHIRQLDTPLAKIPIIAASGNADDAMRRSALAVGCNLFMTKPFNLTMLCREIGKLINERRRATVRRMSSPWPTTPLNRIETRVHEKG